MWFGGTSHRELSAALRGWLVFDTDRVPAACVVVSHVLGLRRQLFFAFDFLALIVLFLLFFELALYFLALIALFLFLIFCVHREPLL